VKSGPRGGVQFGVKFERIEQNSDDLCTPEQSTVGVQATRIHWTGGRKVAGSNPAAPTPKGETLTPAHDQPLGFETDIKPLFREKDRESMQRHFDLWSYDDVSQHADAIFARVQAGTMPCDGAWPQGQVDLLQRWTESGKSR
jgi:hypothetical protein